MIYGKRRYYIKTVAYRFASQSKIPYVDCFYGEAPGQMWWMASIKYDTGKISDPINSLEPELKITLWEF